jgi:hypothetical protein
MERLARRHRLAGYGAVSSEQERDGDRCRTYNPESVTPLETQGVSKAEEVTVWFFGLLVFVSSVFSLRFIASGLD